MIPGGAVLLGFAAAAVFTDLYSRKIPNALTGAGICCGVVTCLARGAGPPCLRFLFSLGGMLLPLLLLGWLFIFRMIGAGDIKLLCMAGSFLGPAKCLRLIAASLLAGGLISAFLMVRRGNLFSRLSFFRTYISDFIRTGRWRPYRSGCPAGAEFCFSVPVLLAAVCVLGGVF